VAGPGGDQGFARYRILGGGAEHQDYLERYPDGYTCHFPRAGWKLPRRAVTAT
jgi:hypothetical protein